MIPRDFIYRIRISKTLDSTSLLQSLALMRYSAACIHTEKPSLSEMWAPAYGYNQTNSEHYHSQVCSVELRPGRRGSFLIPMTLPILVSYPFVEDMSTWPKGMSALTVGDIQSWNRDEILTSYPLVIAAGNLQNEAVAPASGCSMKSCRVCYAMGDKEGAL